jgi:hypothetical protein
VNLSAYSLRSSAIVEQVAKPLPEEAALEFIREWNRDGAAA